MRPHWDRHAATWDAHLPRSELFAELLDTVLAAARPGPEDVVVDLGAGSGFLAIPMAERARLVYAVDHSREMLRLLDRGVRERGLSLRSAPADLRTFAPGEPVDVIVTNYALHHLSHPAKRELLRRCHAWLRPGGRIAVADMMVPLTLRPGQSGPLVHKVWTIARKGPPGWWRILKNLARWGAGRGEYPASLEFWTAALREAGFQGVQGRRVGNESGVAWGVRAPAGRPAEEDSGTPASERGATA